MEDWVQEQGVERLAYDGLDKQDHSGSEESAVYDAKKVCEIECGVAYYCLLTVAVLVQGTVKL